MNILLLSTKLFSFILSISFLVVLLKFLSLSLSSLTQFYNNFYMHYFLLKTFFWYFFDNNNLIAHKSKKRKKKQRFLEMHDQFKFYIIWYTTQSIERDLWKISLEKLNYLQIWCVYIFCISYFQTFMTKVTERWDVWERVVGGWWWWCQHSYDELKNIYLTVSQNIEFNIIFCTLHISLRLTHTRTNSLSLCIAWEFYSVLSMHILN